eukprot:gb/GFBE01070090.1/.p1 GENE.gb/GFBE01070090.1/~~gb/GFBE01070090.1/.p1  ORF type:complete len:302 (+),score=66.73 gb/GFBE01070090.1/:1-906(+)
MTTSEGPTAVLVEVFEASEGSLSGYMTTSEGPTAVLCEVFEASQVREEREQRLHLQQRAMTVFAEVDRRWHLEAWKERLAEAQGRCLSCLAFFPDSSGFCSQCGRTWQMLYDSCDASCEEDARACVFPQEVDEQVALVGKRSDQYQETLNERTDRAVLVVAMPSKTFRHLLRTLRSQSPVPGHEALADMLLAFGHPLLSAAQASELLAVLRSRLQEGAISMYEHVLCSRVIDKWNLTKADHGSGECYYRPDAWKHKNSSRESLIEALRMCGSAQVEACWDSRVKAYVQDLILQLGGQCERL